MIYYVLRRRSCEATRAGASAMPTPTTQVTEGPASGDRRTLPASLAYTLAASIIGLGLFASVTPSPLYREDAVLWNFSSLTLTLIYATYRSRVLATLRRAGSVSAVVGRRPVLLAALGALRSSSVLFRLAELAAWL